ncbi:hypothetical protein DY000_02030938 [Brassica cretica]|uniref:DUF4005 domain-containing protein n=1 Tax=Brassica cretica TaxID=69181 RepID=A0ABQ7DD98_BRACR|nr:hypothetical protein DY000_02030938 [Brassica cretica]
MIQYLAVAQRLIKKFKSCKLTQIPWEQNSQADEHTPACTSMASHPGGTPDVQQESQNQDLPARGLGSTTRRKNNGETHPGWEGPYKVIEVRRAGAYRLQDSKEGKSLYLKGHTSWIRSPGTSDPGQPLQKVARTQWHVHKIKTGMRHKAGMGMRKPGEHMVYLLQKYCEIQGVIKVLLLQTWKAAKPGTWVITATPAPSKHVQVVALPRKVEYGPCEKQNIPGSQGTPEPPGSPIASGFRSKISGSKEEPLGSYMASGFQRRNQKEARTLVQPKAHRGHYNFKEPPGSNQRSSDLRKKPPGSYTASEA